MQFGISLSNFFQRQPRLHEPYGLVQLVFVLSAYSFQIAREKSCDYLIIYTREILRWFSRRNPCISRKNCAINCTIHGKRLISKQKICLVLTKPYCLLANHNPEFRCVICTGITLFALVLQEELCIAPQ